MHYYGTRLSGNISRREPEGYLLCLNVPVARTGVQEYLPEELGLSAASGGNPESTNFTRNKQSPQCGAAPIEGVGKGMPGGGDMVPVQRPEAEVFSPETIASFEGMPVTDGHPPEGVDATNIRFLQKGHVHNVRRGTGDESDLLLADLIITDPRLISLIMDEGKREISCGYTYELCEENGEYIQRKIRGNHVAVVDAGRAGKRVAIRDHRGCGLSAAMQAPLKPAPLVSIKDHKPERRKNNMKKSLSKILARMARDGDIETVAEIIEEMIEPEAAAEGTEVVVVEAPQGEETETAAEAQAPENGAAVENAETAVVVDEPTLGDVIARLDQIIALLTPAAADADPVEEIAEAVEEAIEAVAGAEEIAVAPEGAEEVAEVIEEILEPDEGLVLPEEAEGAGDGCGNEQEVISTGDALRAALKPMRPVLAKMPKAQRDMICADIAARLNGKPVSRKGVYGAMNDAARKRSAAGPDLGRRIMERRNPNYKN